MSALVEAADRIRQAVKTHVEFIHHSGKNQASGARGHSSLRAATDTEIEVTRDETAGVSVAKVTKQRDMDRSGKFPFTLEPVELGRNQRGKPVTSCVVVPGDVPADVPTSAGVRLSDDQRTALDLLVTVIGRDGKGGNPGVPTDRPSVTVEQWRSEFFSKAKAGDTNDAKRMAFKRARDRLVSLEKAMCANDYVWIP
jgi:hypothetical protein